MIRNFEPTLNPVYISAKKRNSGRLHLDEIQPPSRDKYVLGGGRRFL